MNEVKRKNWARFAQTMAISIGLSFAFSFMFSARSGPDRASPLIMALAFGIPFGLVITAIYQGNLHAWRSRSFIVTTLYRVFVHFLGVFAAFVIGLDLTISSVTGLSPFDSHVTSAVGKTVNSRFLIPLLMMVGITVVITVANAMGRKLGPGVLWNWLRGYYHEPREERRIFMFLDMKDSTTLAERLGHLKFSALVRDFMTDLTGPVLETKGEVSHYIGDEAVLTWRMDRGLKNANCLRCHFLMKDQIARRADEYQRRYGLVPEFKSGIHTGLVVITEVGDIKSELVYHGDVLNTTARIQGLCNQFQAELLVSDELIRLLPETSPYEIELLGHQVLKGRVEPVAISRVTRA